MRDVERREFERVRELNERLNRAIQEGSLELPSIQRELITYYEEEE